MTKTTSMIHVPTSVEEMRPSKAADLITEASNFLRAHWNEMRPFFQAISGEAPSLHGSLNFDEAACAFAIKEAAVANGFAVLGTVDDATMWKAVRYAYKRNTGTAVGALEQQNKRLRIEHRRQET